MYPLAELIRRCVENNGNADWQAFLSAPVVRELVRGVFVRYSRFRQRVDEFENWFGVWLYAKNKLKSELELLRAVYGQDVDIPVLGREEHARNYLRQVVQSARSEFEKENRSRLPVTAGADPNKVIRPGPAPHLEERAAEVRVAAQHLSQGNRIPFWLRYLLVCGPLLPEDLAFIQQHRPDAETFINEREIGARANGRQHPLTSAEIGQLLGGISPAAVDQRVTTGLQHVLAFLELPNP
jgi:hypothetical protein